MGLNKTSSLNLRVELSAIHGHGVFVGSFIAKGTILPWNNTRQISQAEFSALPQGEKSFTDIQGGKMYLVGIPERYVNHSCDSNTTPGHLCDIANRDIVEGEEITADYSNFFILNGSFDCQCGSLNCRRTITGRAPEQ